jgi:hypothetical protein
MHEAKMIKRTVFCLGLMLSAVQTLSAAPVVLRARVRVEAVYDEGKLILGDRLAVGSILDVAYVYDTTARDWNANDPQRSSSNYWYLAPPYRVSISNGPDVLFRTNNDRPEMSIGVLDEGVSDWLQFQGYSAELPGLDGETDLIDLTFRSLEGDALQSEEAPSAAPDLAKWRGFLYVAGGLVESVPNSPAPRFSVWAEVIEVTTSATGDPQVNDVDGDGIPDVVDQCPGTVIPEPLPASGASTPENYALWAYHPFFVSYALGPPHAAGPVPGRKSLLPDFTIYDTRGCSCGQVRQLGGLVTSTEGCPVGVLTGFSGTRP